MSDLVDQLGKALDEAGMKVTFTGWKRELELCEAEVEKLKSQLADAQVEVERLKNVDRVFSGGIIIEKLEKQLITQAEKLKLAREAIGELKCDLSTACRYLVEGKAKFTPHTTNSSVDIFIERVGKLLRAHLGDEKEGV